MKPFWYNLPEDRIAQRPVCPPESAKLLVCNRQTESLTDTTFETLQDFIGAGDALVFNDTKVIPARLFGVTDNGASIELLLIKKLAEGKWECMGRPLKRLKEGSNISFRGELRGTVFERTGEKSITVVFSSGNQNNPASDSMIFDAGVMPIPPYIRKGHSDEEDILDYQSIFAKVEGSVAAPTASLHFSPSLVSSLKEGGTIIEHATLHIGAASFLPVITDEMDNHWSAPGVELYRFDKQLLERLQGIRENGHRVIAVGTTITRALESMFRNSSGVTDQYYETDLFITPGFEFRAIDALITNFHQPGTTHLLLLEAFMKKLLPAAYDQALLHGFRFLSYGDAMLVL